MESGVLRQDTFNPHTQTRGEFHSQDSEVVGAAQERDTRLPLLCVLGILWALSVECAFLICLPSTGRE